MQSTQSQRKVVYRNRKCEFCKAEFEPESSRQAHCSWECRFKSIAGKFSGGKCWEWPMSKNIETGYGQFRISSNPPKTASAHRVSYSIFNGEIPDDFQVLHICDNRRCFNPQHLRIGKQIDNVVDMWVKGRNGKTGAKHGEENAQAKLTLEAAIEIRSSSLSSKELALKFNVTSTTINKLRRGDSWSQAQPVQGGQQ